MEGICVICLRCGAITSTANRGISWVFCQHQAPFLNAEGRHRWIVHLYCKQQMKWKASLSFVFLPSSSSWIAIILRVLLFLYIISRRKKLFLLITALVIQTWKWKCLFILLAEVMCSIPPALLLVAELLLLSMRLGCLLEEQEMLWSACFVTAKSTQSQRIEKQPTKMWENMMKTSSYRICGPGNNFRGSKQCQRSAQ